MAITCRFISALAATLLLSSAALSQSTNSPPATSSRAPPATSSTKDDNGINPMTRGGGDYSPTRRGPSAQQPSTEGAQQPSTVGTGPDPTTTRESPFITGNGTAGE
jgi:hypothetical protein